MHDFKIKLVFSVLAFIILIDLYSWQAFKTILKSRGKKIIRIAKGIHYGITILVVTMFLIMNVYVSLEKNVFLRYYLSALVVVLYFPKLITCVFILIDDLQRLLRLILKVIVSFFRKPAGEDKVNGISRAKFLSQTGLLVSSVPFLMLSKGIIKGGYDYQLHKIRLLIKNLPLAFEGMKMVQISDIHSGSLFDKDAVQKGIRMALETRPDIIFFTGDLVNNETPEALPLMDQLAGIKAPMGVFSTFGNHDYGDYISWESEEAKAKNLDDLVKVHRDLGWHLMRNENIFLEKGSSKLALIGVENWGDRGRFQKFGDVEKATEGLEGNFVQLLLSHDPSHFDSIISKQYPEIAVTFSGHTHGFQFGIENKYFRWSPSQYIYPHWAGLYREGEQQLYVNRGFGFLGYPGRVGILPEITLFELSRA